jgi:hypothetical protein
MASHRLLFFPLILLWIGGLWSWSLTHPELSSRAQEGVPFQSAKLEEELLDVLDQIVTQEHSYYRTHGQFTRMISRIGVNIPKRVEQAYEIRVDEATTESLKVIAVSDLSLGPSQVENRASIDQDYFVRANFPLPTPRADFLRRQTERNLKTMARSRSEPLEKGIFQGYFRYQKLSDDSILAIGVRTPVEGMKLDSRSSVNSSGEVLNSDANDSLSGNRSPASVLEIEPVDADSSATESSGLELEALSVPDVLPGHRASRN